METPALDPLDLGFATSGEDQTGHNGNVAQNFQNGVIRWGPAGTGITY